MALTPSTLSELNSDDQNAEPISSIIADEVMDDAGHVAAYAPSDVKRMLARAAREGAEYALTHYADRLFKGYFDADLPDNFHTQGTRAALETSLRKEAGKAI